MRRFTVLDRSFAGIWDRLPSRAPQGACFPLGPTFSQRVDPKRTSLHKRLSPIKLAKALFTQIMRKMWPTATGSACLHIQPFRTHIFLAKAYARLALYPLQEHEEARNPP